MSMELRQLLLQYRWRNSLGVCIGCEEPYKYGGVLCSFCQLFRYCSPGCLEKDRLRHKSACEVLTYFKENAHELHEYAQTGFRDFIYRVKLLDSEGNLISPFVMQEVQLVNSSSRLSKVVANLVTLSKSDTGSASSSESTDEAVLRNENGSVCDIKSKSDSSSMNYTLSTIDRGCTNDTKCKNDIECKSDSGIMTNSGSISDSGLKNNSGSKSTSDTRYKRDTGSKNDGGSKNDSGSKNESGSKGDSETCRSKVRNSDPGQKNVNVTFPFKMKDTNVRQPTDVSELFQQAASCGADGSCLRGHFNIPDHMKQHAMTSKKHQQAAKGSSNREDHLDSASSHSNNSHSSSRNVSHSKSNETNVSESFGSGWWGKTNKVCSRKSTQGNKSSKLLNSDENHQMENEHMQKSHSAKVMSPAEEHIPDSTETREPSEAKRFGSGWWQSRSAQTNSTSTKREIKVNSQRGQSVNEKRLVQSNNQRTSNKSELSNCASKNSALDNNKLDKSDSRKTTSNNCAFDRNASTNNSETSSRNGALKTCADREEPDSNNFGAGWWKHRTSRHNTGSGNSTKSTTDKAATNVGKSKLLTEQNKQSQESCGFVNTCTDISPFEIFITPEHILRFAKVASYISSSQVRSEATQGRVIVMGLLSVPGLWRASLGGSRISLVVEIVMRIPKQLPNQMPGVIVHDKLGHVAPVVFNMSESTTYTVSGTQGLLTVPISECLKPGTFVLLRAVNWELLSSKHLAIVMRDMSCVDFIFYELIE